MKGLPLCHARHTTPAFSPLSLSQELKNSYSLLVLLCQLSFAEKLASSSVPCCPYLQLHILGPRAFIAWCMVHSTSASQRLPASPLLHQQKMACK